MGSWAASGFTLTSLSFLRCGKQTRVLEALPFPPHYSRVCYQEVSQPRNIANRGLINQLLRLLVWSASVHLALYFRATDSFLMSSHNVFAAAGSQGDSLTMPAGSDMHCRGVGHLFLLVLTSWLPLLPLCCLHPCEGSVLFETAGRWVDTAVLLSLPTLASNDSWAVYRAYYWRSLGYWISRVQVVVCIRSSWKSQPCLLGSCRVWSLHVNKQRSFVPLCFDFKEMESHFF